MKTGLYFGSFNPIHIGHLIIANHVLNNTDLKKIWFVVSPHNPLKESATLLEEYKRLNLVRTAIEDDYRLKASDIEFNLPRPSYTINTLTYLKEKYPETEFCIIMGSDSLQNIAKWKNYTQIIDNHEIIVYERPGFAAEMSHPNIHILQHTPFINISATQIRELIKAGKSARYLLPEKVYEEILKGGYY